MAAGAPLIAMSGPFAPVTALGLGLAGGFGGSAAGQWGQDAALRTFAPEFQQQLQADMATDADAHPIAAFLGQTAPQLLGMKPSLQNLKGAGQAAANVAKRAPVTAKQAAQLANVGIGAAVGSGSEAIPALMRGEAPDPARTMLAGVTGSVLSEPTKIGKKLGVKPSIDVPNAAPEPVRITTEDAPPRGSPQAAKAERVARVREAIKTAGPVRKEQEALYTQARSQRLARMMAMREKVGGEAGYHAELGQLKGELPKAQFEAIRPALQPDDLDNLFNDINASDLGPWDQLHAKSGLAKLLSTEGGTVPQRSELILLQDVFGPELVQAALKKRPWLARAGSAAGEVLNVPRALMATLDLSAPLRQGAFLIGRPKQWGPAFGTMLRQFTSETAFQASQQQIRQRPTYQTMRQAKLALTDTGPMLSTREEAFMSKLVEGVPGVRASNRAYVGFLNRLRADVFDDILKKGEALGLAEDQAFLDSLGSFVNTATGRGPLRYAGVGPVTGNTELERTAVALNTVLFSPRLLASRLSLLDPSYYVQLHPTVRKEAVGSLLTFAATGLSVLGLAKMSGAEVGVDPRSADFGKIKVGNTRYDVLGGFQQPIVAATRLMTGEMVSSTTGREFALGDGYKATTRKDIAQRFVESKASPIGSFALALLDGKTQTGEQVRVSAEIVDRFIPMLAQDLYELTREQGASRAWMALPAVFGVGVQTYGQPIPQATLTDAGRETISWRQPPSLGETLVNKATGTQVSNVPTSMHPALQHARQQETQRKLSINQAKRMVLETGQPQQVGQTTVYLERGVVKTKTRGRVQTPARVYQQSRGQPKE